MHTAHLTDDAPCANMSVMEQPPHTAWPTALAATAQLTAPQSEHCGKVAARAVESNETVLRDVPRNDSDLRSRQG